MTLLPPRAPVLELHGIRQTYGSGDTAVHALRGIDLTVDRGEYLAIMGPSGSGKSTLMNLLGCLDVASSGTYVLEGHDVASLDERALARVRGRRIGFVFQSFNLIPRMSALANVELPMVYARVRRAERRQRAEAALDLVGLADRAGHLPNALSGGQQQRVAIARALVADPAILLADEPTGNLDSASTEDVLEILDRLSGEGRTIVVITHEDAVGARAGRVVHIRDGMLVSDVRRRGAVAAEPAGSAR
jgi:putative ABC transport system ATP-binding protein